MYSFDIVNTSHLTCLLTMYRQNCKNGLFILFFIFIIKHKNEEKKGRVSLCLEQISVHYMYILFVSRQICKYMIN